MAEFRLPKNSQITDGITYKALADAAKVKTFKIYRWSPDDDAQPILLKLILMIAAQWCLMR